MEGYVINPSVTPRKGVTALRSCDRNNYDFHDMVQPSAFFENFGVPSEFKSVAFVAQPSTDKIA